MKIYHGSDIEVKNPEIRTGKFTKDFGEGFYCTDASLRCLSFVESEKISKK